jgi:hypothetical protein
MERSLVGGSVRNWRALEQQLYSNEHALSGVDGDFDGRLVTAVRTSVNDDACYPCWAKIAVEWLGRRDVA